tara:strand:- start:28 stop:1215 length:1188 start_codon:yes stop_codon:yes gene_type:complete
MPLPKIKNLINKTDYRDDNTSFPPIGHYLVIGILGLVIFIGGFVIWFSFSSLESASIAQGKLIAETKNKTIKHLEGGIIHTIHVTDGDMVTKGQLLITLDNTKAQAALDVLQKKYLSLVAEEARLIAQRDKEQHIKWPADVEDEPKLQKIQKNILKANILSFDGQLKILNKQIDQLNKEIESYQARLVAGEDQLIYIQQELEMYQKLEKKKLIELPRLLEMKRKLSNLKGNQGELRGQIARAEQKIGETKQKIITLKDDYQKNVLTELKDVRDKLDDVKPKLEAAIDTLERTTITSPNDGIVVGLTQFTKGGVISPGESLMNIFPSRDKLIAEAEVNPADIELIHKGLKARVYLTAYKQRNTPSLTGEVVYVSADIFVNDKTNQSFYKAYIRPLA